jgi:hypothetical protein
MNGAKLATNAFAAANEKAPAGRNTNRRPAFVAPVTEVVYPRISPSRRLEPRVDGLALEGEDGEPVPRWGKA